MPPGVGALGLAVGRPAPGARRSAIESNDEKSRPAQNEAPSPRQHDDADARASDFSCSPASRSPANIAPSSALRLSARFMRTSAMPRSSMLMVTRSLIAPLSPAMLTGMKLNLSADEVLTTTR